MITYELLVELHSILIGWFWLTFKNKMADGGHFKQDAPNYYILFYSIWYAI